MGLKGEEVNKLVMKNVIISLILLLFQTFYTFIIVLGWYKSLVETHRTHEAFKDADSSQLLRMPASMIN